MDGSGINLALVGDQVMGTLRSTDGEALPPHLVSCTDWRDRDVAETRYSAASNGSSMAAAANSRCCSRPRARSDGDRRLQDAIAALQHAHYVPGAIIDTIHPLGEKRARSADLA